MGVLVVKLGTSTVTTERGLNGKSLLRLAGAISELRDRGWRTVVVSSGAVGAGRRRLGLAKPRTIAEKQAAAAVGQGLLMHSYETFLAPLGLTSAQLLLTREDLSDRQRYLNASNTLSALLSFEGVVPIINENDSVAVDELKVGDNDTLSALVAQLVDADWLSILSDVPGLYDRPPSDPEASLIAEVEEIGPEIEALAGGPGSDLGTGGMATKIQAARIATSSGIPMALMSGQDPGQLIRLVERQSINGTIFRARRDRLESRKQWFAFGKAPRGRLILDAGAIAALVQGGKSLLPAGVLTVEGDFSAGESVSVLSESGRELARGLSNYSADELRKIRGQKSADVERVLGYKPADEVIHRNNLALL